MYNLKGEIKVINDEAQVTDSFKKREFVVIDSSGQYEQTILFQVVQDKCAELDNLNVGDVVSVDFFLRGREWTNPKDNKVSFFNSLDAWKVVASEITVEEPTNKQMSDDTDDDLPF